MRPARHALLFVSCLWLSCISPADEVEYDDLDGGMEVLSDPALGTSVQALQTSLCGNMGGLQANSPSPMRGGCPSHASQSSLYGPATNTKNWEHDFLWDVRSAPAVAADGTIYIGSDDGYFYALNPTTGATAWRIFLWNQVQSSPAIAADGTVYVGSHANKVHAINPVTRTEKYTAFDTFGDVTASPAIGGDGTIYVGSHTGKFYALNPNLTKKWEYPTSNKIRSSAAIGPDGTVFFGSDDNHLYALNADGSLKWSEDILFANIESSPAVANGRVYVGSNQNKLHAFDAQTGDLLWERDLGLGNVVSSPAVDANGVVYVGGGDFKLHAFTPEGIELWAFPTLGCIVSSPVIDRAGNVYFGSEDDSLYAVDAGGNLLWKYTTWNNVAGTPVIGANGAVLVGSDDNKLHSVGVAGPVPKTVGQACTEDTQCAVGLVCGETNGERFGLTTDRACWLPSCQNGVKDPAETKVDCGGPCGDCTDICARPCALGDQVLPDAIAKLDFDSGNFIRGSLATFAKENGHIERATGHQLRYIGVEGGKRMALFEGERTNTVIRSEELNAFPGWFVPDFLSGPPIVLQADAAVAPDGKTSADRLQAPSGGIPAAIQLAANPQGPGSLSAYLKDAGTGGKTRLILFDPIVSNLYANPDPWDLPAQWTRFDKSSQAAAIPLYLAASHVQNYPAGLGGLIPSLPSATYYLWGIQWESGSFPSSYLPTNDQYRKRNPDRLTFTAAQVPAWMRTGMWQFDVQPEYSSAEIEDGEEFVLFSFGGSEHVVALQKTNGEGHLVVKTGGAVRFAATLSWSRGQLLTVTVDASTGKLAVRGASLGAPTLSMPFQFPALSLRVGGVLGGANEAFAGLSAPRSVAVAELVCEESLDCHCGDGIVSGAEECDPARDTFCTKHCRSVTSPITGNTQEDCGLGQYLSAVSGSLFGLDPTVSVCIPRDPCLTQPGQECGTVTSMCGLCGCTPQCIGIQCGDALDDGCGGLCPAVCAPRECGCRFDWQCPSDYRCSVGAGARFGCAETDGVCVPEVCSDSPRNRDLCAQVSDLCGICPDMPALCLDSECGVDENGRPCPHACGEDELCVANKCVQPAGQKHRDPTVPEPVAPSAGELPAAGAVPAVLKVDDGGNALYSIGIEVPMGYNGIQPKLSLQYSSNLGNGYAGMGWTVTGFGLSVIHRCAKNYADDGKSQAPQFLRVGEEDALCLNGQRLVVVGESADEIEYRTIPDTFAKIVGHKDWRHNGPLSLTVYAKDGTIHEYGEELSGCPAPPSNGRDGSCNYSRFYKYPGQNTPRSASIRGWALSRVHDRAGNELKIRYVGSESCRASGVCGVDEIRPLRMDYSGGGWVTFVYQESIRRDPFSGFQQGVTLRKTRLLQKIVSGSTFGDHRSYWIDYRSHAGHGFDEYEPSAISEIHLCGSDAASRASLPCLPPTKFQYDSSDYPGFGHATTVVDESDDHNYVRHLSGDLDGDGKDELIAFIGTRDDAVGFLAKRTRIYSDYRVDGNVSRFHQQQDLDVVAGEPYVFASRVLVDLNGDGKDEVLAYIDDTPGFGVPAAWRMDLRWNFLSWNDGRFEPFAPFPDDMLDIPSVVDVDGNGEKDILFCRPDEWKVHLQFGGEFDIDPIVFDAPSYRDGTPFNCFRSKEPDDAFQPLIHDVDGDGQAELLTLDTWESTVGGRAFMPYRIAFVVDADARSVAATMELFGGYGVNEGVSYFLDGPWGDFNGDGYPEPFGYVNTGDAFELTNALSQSLDLPGSYPGSYPAPRMAMDYDGDGQDDVFEDINVGSNYYEGRFRRVETWRSGSTNPIQSLSAGDFNGDGIQDLVFVESRNLRTPRILKVREGQRPRRTLTRVEDALGNQLLINYGYESQGAYYEKVPCVAPCADAKPPVNVVEKTTLVQPGQVGPRETSYSYQGAHRDVQRKVSLGFAGRVEKSGRGWHAKYYERKHSKAGGTRHTPGHGGGFFSTASPAFEFKVATHKDSQLSGGGGSLLDPMGADIQGSFIERSFVEKDSTVGVPFVYTNEFRRSSLHGRHASLHSQWSLEQVLGVAQLRYEVSTAEVVDAHGNRTSSISHWDDGTSVQIRSRYLGPSAFGGAWLTGLKQRELIRWSQPSEAGLADTKYRRMSFEYDDRGFLIGSVREPDIEPWDTEGQSGSALSEMESTRELHQLRTEFAVDASGRIEAVSSISPDEMRTTSLVFSTNQNRVHPEYSFNELGHKTVLDYDRNSGQILYVRHPDGRTEKNGYDALGRLIQVEEPEGVTTISFAQRPPFSIATTQNGSELQVNSVYSRTTTYPDGKRETVLFDSLVRPVRRVYLSPDASFASTETVYDSLGNVFLETRPHEVSEPVTSYTMYGWDSAGRQRYSFETHPDGQKLTQTHWAHADDVTQSHAHVLSRLKKPDAARDVVLRIDGLGNTEYAVLDARGKLLARYQPGGTWTSFEYAPFDLVSRASVQNSSGILASSSASPSAYGWVLERTDPTTGTTEQFYSSFGELVAEVDGNGQRTEYHYDSLGRMYRKESPDGIAEWAYDCLREDQDANQQCPFVSSSSGTSEAAGKLVWSLSSDGHESFRTYDTAFGKVESDVHRVQSGTGTGYEEFVFDYEYDAAGRLRHMLYPESEGLRVALRYGYIAGGVYSIDWIENSGPARIWKRGPERTGIREVFEYGNGLTSMREYYPESGRLKMLASWRTQAGLNPELVAGGGSNGSLLSRWDLTFDANTNLTSRGSLGDGFSTVSTYDELNRLVSERRVNDGSSPSDPGNQILTQLEYDPLGNIAEKSGVGIYVYDPLRPYVLSSVGDEVYQHDDRGNQVGRSGSGILGLAQTLEFTHSNELRSIAFGDEAPAIYYEYDAFGNRVRLSRPDVTVTYAGKVFDRIDGPGSTIYRARVVVDGKTVAEVDQQGAEYSWRYYHLDWGGSPTLVTDESGAVLASPRFEPFGASTFDMGDVGFTGHRLIEPDVGLIYMGARYYDPRLGMFVGVDPLIADPTSFVSMAPYSYGYNNPHRYSDPDGRQAKECEYCADAVVSGPEEASLPDYTVVVDVFGPEFTDYAMASEIESERSSSAMFSVVSGSLSPGRLSLGEGLAWTGVGVASGAALTLSTGFFLGGLMAASPLWGMAVAGTLAFGVSYQLTFGGGFREMAIVGANLKNGTPTASDLYTLGAMAGSLLRAPKVPSAVGQGAQVTASQARLGISAGSAAGGGAATRAGYNGVQGPAQVTTRTTRAGESGAQIRFPDGSVKDVTPSRVKEFVPNTHPNAPPNAQQRVPFENAQPGTKGFKRDPTPEDLEWLP